MKLVKYTNEYRVFTNGLVNVLMRQCANMLMNTNALIKRIAILIINKSANENTVWVFSLAHYQIS